MGKNRREREKGEWRSRGRGGDGLIPTTAANIGVVACLLGLQGSPTTPMVAVVAEIGATTTPNLPISLFSVPAAIALDEVADYLPISRFNRERERWGDQGRWWPRSRPPPPQTRLPAALEVVGTLVCDGGGRDWGGHHPLPFLLLQISTLF
ncbi:hypothetical protein CRG98_002548 [Punica granatum]|uniref:Uncharacterized protein n=1 Tax=Punica granatum TaxID=22663 RepID=A0A2I0L8M1_PUNGR|nr:hypothetical protein CRG98_002548 [Punica granatum]